MLFTSWIDLAVCGLAVFRLTVLIVDDTEPWNIFSRFRSWTSRMARKHAWFRKSAYHRGIRCHKCVCVYSSAFVLLIHHNPVGVILVALLALSGLSILLNRIPEA